MINLPSSRRHLLTALAVLAVILLWKSSSGIPPAVPSLIFHQPAPPPAGIRVPISNLPDKSLHELNQSENHLTPPKHYFYSWEPSINGKKAANSTSSWAQPVLNLNLEALWKCPRQANRFTGHIRLPNIIRNISMIPTGIDADGRIFWNPTVIALPYWSPNQYLVVSRIVTDGNYQECVICEARSCYVGSPENGRTGEEACTQEDLEKVGPAGGLRCATKPTRISVPPTPAKYCGGKYATYVDIPGFHDPRIFYSGRGEPLMIVNTQSRYACFGLWIIDLRSIHPPLASILTSSPRRLSLGPLTSYSHLTELTRNPPSTRAPIEKNWLLFFPRSGSSFIHYDISSPHTPDRGRTFAKLLGGGLTTPNLTDPHETPCLHSMALQQDEDMDEAKRGGKWHQATNSLRLVLCKRADSACASNDSNTVFFAVVHRKHANYLKLPLRYERYFVVWGGLAPFSMLGVSRHPVLMANETASGWDMWQNWDDEPENAKTVRMYKKKYGSVNGTGVNATDPFGGKKYWAYFTYTVSLAWAAGRGVEAEGWNEGYLDDEVVLSIGIDDTGQGVARVKAGDLVGCLRACPGRGV